MTTDHDERPVAGAAPSPGGFAVSGISGEEQAMEMTEYGKHGKP
jgi:hypothetical protein